MKKRIIVTITPIFIITLKNLDKYTKEKKVEHMYTQNISI